MSSKKLAVISGAFPPQIVGSTILLHNLLSNYEGPVEAIAAQGYGAPIDPDFHPPCKTHYLRMPTAFLRKAFDRYLHKILPFIKLFIKYKLKKIKPDKVLGVCPNGEFFIIAYQASRELGIPFMAHMHDLWEENMAEGSIRLKNAVKWEPAILKNADTVFCMTDIQKEFYQNKYGLNASILPHTLPSERIQNIAPFDPAKYEREPVSIVYTGNISSIMNLDAVQQFIKAIDYMPEHYQIKMFVSWSTEKLKKQKVFHSRVEYKWLPKEAVQKEMQEAHALFLPLSFKNASMDEVRTVFATKTLDYLVSGTPILVYSPADAYHSISAKEKGWGYVVDEDDPKKLAEALKKLTSNQEMAQQIVNNACREANDREAKRYADFLLKKVNEN